VSTKIIEHIHWPNLPDVWMRYAPAIKVTGWTTVYPAGVTAAPVYHHYPRRTEEFDTMSCEMEGQTRAALENLKCSLAAVGAGCGVVVMPLRARLVGTGRAQPRGGEYFGDNKATTTTVQVVRLARDPRCLIEINAITVIS
jgi:enamine deaminase RidA (YjgF/YER057c/UK114 family)